LKFIFNFTDDIENEESLCDVPRTSMPELSLVKTPMDQMTATVSTLTFIFQSQSSLIWYRCFYVYFRLWRRSSLVLPWLASLRSGNNRTLPFQILQVWSMGLYKTRYSTLDNLMIYCFDL